MILLDEMSLDIYMHYRKEQHANSQAGFSNERR